VSIKELKEDPDCGSCLEVSIYLIRLCLKVFNTRLLKIWLFIQEIAKKL